MKKSTNLCGDGYMDFFRYTDHMATDVFLDENKIK